MSPKPKFDNMSNYSVVPAVNALLSFFLEEYSAVLLLMVTWEHSKTKHSCNENSED